MENHVERATHNDHRANYADDDAHMAEESLTEESTNGARDNAPASVLWLRDAVNQEAVA